MTEETEFTMLVRDAVRRIPAGETRTYKQVAEHIGRPNACRAVANAMRNNPFSMHALTRGECTEQQFVPCHRVVDSKGRHNGYLDDTSEAACAFKKALLDAERSDEKVAWLFP